MARLWEQQLVARAELDAAVAALQVAEGRYQDALEEVQNRQAVLLQRRSEVELARQQLADTAIVSPIDGAVVERQASVGEYLAAGAPVVTLVSLHPLRLRLSVPERDAISVRRGQPVRVSVDGDAGVHLGTVARLSPMITEQNRTLLIEAEVPNASSRLRPGAFAKAEVVVETGRPGRHRAGVGARDLRGRGEGAHRPERQERRAPRRPRAAGSASRSRSCRA